MSVNYTHIDGISEYKVQRALDLFERFVIALEKVATAVSAPKLMEQDANHGGEDDCPAGEEDGYNRGF